MAISESPARSRFAEIAAQDDDDIDLAEAALWIAAEARPGLDVADYLGRLARIADSVGSLRGDLPERVETLNRQLFGVHGFHGAPPEAYYEPDNSFLDQVIERKTGIPITLCVLWVEVARRLGLDAHGVSFPGHFLARVGEGPIIVDAFEGRVATPAECDARLASLFGPDFEPPPGLLAPASHKTILLRMLSNLKAIYASQHDLEAALACCDRSLLLFPDSPLELRDRGLMYHGLDFARAALADLERYLELAPAGEDSDAIRQLASRLGRNLPPLH